MAGVVLSGLLAPCAVSAAAPTLASDLGVSQVPARAGAPLRPTANRSTVATIECGLDKKPISPLVYGIAYDAIHDAASPQQWTMGATARRWGGNTATRYNWKSHVWNTALDYFWRNVAVTGHESFLADNELHHVTSVLTVPTIGWVAKDSRSYSFPVSSNGSQQAVDPENPDIGNGVDSKGKKIDPPDPGRTSVAAPPAFIGQWVAGVKDRVDQYQLDNEPEIWNTTHRDVHPNPLSYDELWQRTRDYASAIRKNDPTAVISGPASWGWLGYNFSAVDAAAGFGSKPDRRRHDDLPLLEWYLQQLKAYEVKTGVRLVDVLDVHYYPQEDNVYGQSGRIDPAGAALRIRSTRSLWDPTYTDESWIDTKIALIPRLRGWIRDSYPGTRISIGEWNFGAETHMSGGLATAEALGRFGQQGVYAAYYWAYPPADSPSYWAFRAFRDVDGSGMRFGDTSVRASVKDRNAASLFASIDARGKVVAVALNLSPSATL